MFFPHSIQSFMGFRLILGLLLIYIWTTSDRARLFPIYKRSFSCLDPKLGSVTTALLESAEGENDCRKYFMINLHERMLPTSTGVEPVTSWSPVGLASNLATEASYLFCLYLFFISPSFGASGGLCILIVAFPLYLHHLFLVL